MRANRIVKSLNVPENYGLSLRTSDKGMKINAFTLQAAEKVLSNGVIIRITLTRHTLNDIMGVEKISKGIRGILRAAIRVEDEIGGWTLTIESNI